MRRSETCGDARLTSPLVASTLPKPASHTRLGTGELRPGLAMTAPEWITVPALAAVRGSGEDAARRLMLRWERLGWPRVRRVRSRRGRPRLEVHAGDYHRLCDGLGPPAEARAA